jgi:hypothetical protein
MPNPVTNALRKGRGVLEAAAALGTGMAADIPAGSAGLYALLTGRGLDQAAEDVETTRERFTYRPRTAEGEESLAGVGEVVERGTEAAMRVPGARQAQGAWEGYTRRAPLAAALTAGVVGAGVPETRGLSAAERTAASAPRVVRELGVGKAARERATARRLAEQQAEIEALRAASGGTLPSSKVGKRTARDATHYRDLYAEQGLGPVLAEAKAGKHLIPGVGGGYVGAPRTVRSGPQLGAMRRSLDRQIGEGAEALQFADPERVGTWYDRAKAAQAASNEPYQLPRSLEQTAVYSAGVSPESELGFALRHANTRALGEPEKAYRSSGMNTLDRAVAEDRPAKLAPKIGEYRGKNDPAQIEDSPFGVNDFRAAQGFGYTDAMGVPWTASVSDTMHPFMDAEMALAVERANKKGLGGRTDWTGARAQEVPWVLGKAEDLYTRGSAGRFAGEGAEGQIAALREANNTIADYMPKHTLSATMEYVPGKNTGHVPEAFDMTYEQRRAYGESGRWDQPAPEGTVSMPGGEVGAGNRDILYGAAGFRQLPALESVGNYRNAAGEIEQNPMTIARPLMDFENAAAAKAAGREGLANTINPPTQRAVEAIETFRGVMDAQEAAAANLPVTMGGRTGKQHMLLDRGTPPTQDEMNAVIEALRKAGAPESLLGNITATDRGIQMFTGFEENPRRTANILKRAEADIAAALPGSKGFTASANEGAYVPAMSTAEEAGKGIATSRVLETMAAAPEQVALNVSESEAVRKALRAKTARDAQMPGAREDVQRMREFFSEKDWAPVAALIRKGMKPAAAMAALGYSLEGLAAENPQ